MNPQATNDDSRRLNFHRKVKALSQPEKDKLDSLIIELRKEMKLLISTLIISVKSPTRKKSSSESTDKRTQLIENFDLLVRLSYRPSARMLDEMVSSTLALSGTRSLFGSASIEYDQTWRCYIDVASKSYYVLRRLVMLYGKLKEQAAVNEGSGDDNNQSGEQLMGASDWIYKNQVKRISLALVELVGSKDFSAANELDYAEIQCLNECFKSMRMKRYQQDERKIILLQMLYPAIELNSYNKNNGRGYFILKDEYHTSEVNYDNFYLDNVTSIVALRTMQDLFNKDPESLKTILDLASSMIDDQAPDIDAALCCLGAVFSSLHHQSNSSSIASLFDKQVASLFKSQDAHRRARACWLLRSCIEISRAHINNLDEHLSSLMDMISDESLIVKLECRICLRQIFMYKNLDPLIAVKFAPEFIERLFKSIEKNLNLNILDRQLEFDIYLIRLISERCEKSLIIIYNTSKLFHYLKSHLDQDLYQPSRGVVLQFMISIHSCCKMLSIEERKSFEKPLWDLGWKLIHGRLDKAKPDLIANKLLELASCLGDNLLEIGMLSEYPGAVVSNWLNLRQSGRPRVFMTMNRLIRESKSTYDTNYLRLFFGKMFINQRNRLSAEEIKIMETISTKLMGDILSGRLLSLRAFFPELQDDDQIPDYFVNLKPHLYNTFQFLLPWVDLVGVGDRRDLYQSFRPPGNEIQSIIFDTIKLCGMHDRRLRLILLCDILKDIQDYNSFETSRKSLLETILELCLKLAISYKIRCRTGSDDEISSTDIDCYPSCLELAFANERDDPYMGRLYQCEFAHFRYIMKYLERKRPDFYQELVASLDKEQSERLDHFRYVFGPDGYYEKFTDIDVIAFHCVGHKNLVNHDTPIKAVDPRLIYCPLMERMGYNRQLTKLIKSSPHQ